MDIEDWREKIDGIDLRILHCLNERAEASIAIAHLKNEKHLSIYDPDRETWIIKRMIQENSGPLSNDGVRRVFERIIDESRKLEKDILSTKATHKEKPE